MLAGWAVSLGAAALLWPASGAPTTRGARHGAVEGARNGAIGGWDRIGWMTEDVARLAMVLAVLALGISAALIIIPSLPDLQARLLLIASDCF